MTRILVTGASGFMGAHLAKKLLDAKHEVHSIQHDAKPFDSASVLGIKNQITWSFGDIQNYDFVLRVVSDYEIEEIYHLAALPIVRIAGRNPLPVFSTNICGTVNVLQAAKENGSRVVVIATDKVYGDSGDSSYQEDTPLKGYGVYESSKACCDIITRCYHYEYDLTCGVVRPSNVFGPADFNSRIIPNTIRRVLKGQTPILYRGVGYRREFIYVDDWSDAMILVMGHLPTLITSAYETLDKSKQRDRSAVASSLSWNIGSGESFTQEETLAAILKHFPGVTPETREPMPYMKLEIPYQRLDSTKIRQLGWYPKTKFVDGVTETVQWWKSHPEWR